MLDYTHTKLIERELLLIKVSILGPEHLHEQLPTARMDNDVEYADEKLSATAEVGSAAESRRIYLALTASM